MLMYVTATYRNAKHETTGFSPNRMVYGREVQHTVDHLIERKVPSRKYPVAYVDWLQHSLLLTKQVVAELIKKAQEQQKKYHDQKLKALNIDSEIKF